MIIPLIVIGIFLGLLLVGMPIFAGMGVAAVAGMLLLGESDAPFLDIALTAYQTMGNFLLIAVPLYIYAGTLMETAGLSKKLFRLAHVWFGHIPGGLGVSTVVACAIFAAISGSSVATAVTIGLVAYPALTRAGYLPHFSGALIAAGGTLGILIPPSIAMIIFGFLTEQSIAKLFVAGAVPGLLLAAVMAIYTMLLARVEATPEQFTWADRIQATREAIWVILLPIGVLVSIYTGFATPTEVAAIAVFYVVAVGVGGGTLTWQSFGAATLTATRTSAMLFMMIVFGQSMAEVLILTGLPQTVIELVAQADLSFTAVVLLMILIYLVLGMFLEAMAMILVTIPILYPLSQAIGMDPLAFGVFVVIAIEMGQITPPVGLNLFALSAIGKIHLGRMSMSAIPYVLVMVGMMLAIAYFPEIATWLPGTMG